MEGYDKEKAARVWQRVQGSVAEDSTRGLTGMIAERFSSVTACREMDRVMGRFSFASRRIPGTTPQVEREM